MHSFFIYIKAQKEKFVAAGRPILSIDAKKKEPIGNYKNGGRELCAKSSPEHVNVYDFVDPQVGRATPYGVYDITQNKGWVSVGISFDTARFAVNTLRQWWLNCGERKYAGTRGLLVMRMAAAATDRAFVCGKYPFKNLPMKTLPSALPSMSGVAAGRPRSAMSPRRGLSARKSSRSRFTEAQAPHSM